MSSGSATRYTFMRSLRLLTRDEALIMESMNDGMHWTAEVDYYFVNMFCTNMVPLDAVPLLFKTAGIDPIRYTIKDVKEERLK